MSHRSYRPVQPCGNKLLQKQWDQRYYDEHRRLVRSAKPMVDTKPPVKHQHLTSKLKKQQLEKERSDEIERDNLALLKKMQHIMTTQGQVDHKHAYKHHSLNDLQRQRELERVSKDNKEMLKRLQQVEPMYRVQEWIDDWQRKEDHTERITAFPSAMATTTPKMKSACSKEKPTEEGQTEPQACEKTDDPDPTTVEIEKDST